MSMKIEELQKRHTELYRRAMTDKRNDLLFAGGDESPFVTEATLLADDIMKASAEADSLDDYEWLGKVATKWQLVFSSILNVPKTITLRPPSKDLLPPPVTQDGLLTSEELDLCIRRHAAALQVYRYSRRTVSPEEAELDRYGAEVFFMSEILGGEINFAVRIGEHSYGLLEKHWLKEIKDLSRSLSSTPCYSRKNNAIPACYE
jgi:hypothetical protein